MLPATSDTAAVLSTIILAGAAVWLVWTVRRYWLHERRKQRDLVTTINRLLPQTQCGRWSYEGCLPYAQAIASGEAINKCPPGGDSTIAALAILLTEHPRPLDPAHGQHTPTQVAVIREDECIGCTKCIRACPVDAIIGGPKLMHTVIADECNGCDLCLDPCPVDCIDLVPVSSHGSTRGSGEHGELIPLRNLLAC